MRIKQHKQDYRNVVGSSHQEGESSSWMADHYWDYHRNESLPDPDKDYSFQVIGTHRDPLSRQLEEAIRINKALDTGILIDRRNEESKVKSLNRRGETFAAYKRWNPGFQSS